MIRDDLQRATKCIEINQCSLSLPPAKNLEGVPPYGMVPIMEGVELLFSQRRGIFFNYKYCTCRCKGFQSSPSKKQAPLNYRWGTEI